jgi:hypothetical protein
VWRHQLRARNRGGAGRRQAAGGREEASGRTALASSEHDAPSDLQIAAKTIREVVAPETLVADEESANDRRYLNVARTIDDMVSIECMLDPESGAHVIAAVHAYATPLGPDDRRTRAQRRADAFTEVLKAGLEAAALPDTGGDKPHVAFTVDLSPALHREEHDSQGVRHARLLIARFPDGTTLVGETVARLLCDMSLHRVVTLGPSEVLDIGRRTRLWRAAIRRAVAMTYNGCAARGCDRARRRHRPAPRRPLDGGGATALDNLVPQGIPLPVTGPCSRRSRHGPGPLQFPEAARVRNHRRRWRLEGRPLRHACDDVSAATGH